MIAIPLENYGVTMDLIYQQPIRFYMAFSSTHIIPGEFVVSVNRIQPLTSDQTTDNHLQFLHVLSTPLSELNVFGELLRVGRRIHQIPNFWNMSFASLQRITSRPASVASNVLRVVSFGILTSNGSPFRRTTCL